MSKRLLGIAVAAALALGVGLTAVIPAASTAHSTAAAGSQVGTSTGVTFYPAPVARLRVTTRKQQHGRVVTLSFRFSGARATGLILGTQKGVSLSSRNFTRIGRNLKLTTATGARLRYRLLAARTTYFAAVFRTGYTRFTLRFNLGLVRFSRAEARLIRLHRVRRIVFALAFPGGPRQLAGARVTVTV